MPEFRGLFNQWAPKYDDTVYGINNEYSDVFKNYDQILNGIFIEVQSLKRVIEIGTGTGNLAKVLVDGEVDVICIEPSEEMRKIAVNKLPNVSIIDGHFLSIPIEEKVDAVVSSYAFHHLTVDEKQSAIAYMDNLINEKGKIIIADTMFESKQYKENLLQCVEDKGAYKLLHDLNTEYYEYLQNIVNLLTDRNYEVSYKKMNDYVWIVTGIKGGIENE